MLIKKLDYITEFFLWVLAYGVTLANAPTEVASYWIIFLFLIKKIASRDIKFLKSSISVLLCVLFVIVFISFLRSDFFKESLKGFSRMPKYIFLYFALTDFFSRDNKRMLRFFWVLMAVAAVTFLNGIFQSIFGFDVFKHNVIGKVGSSLRIYSSFINPNDFGAYIATILPLTFLFLKKEISSNRRIFLFAIFLIGFYCLMWASSRGAWIGFIVAMIVFFGVYRKKMLIFVPIAALILVLLSPSGIYRVKGLFNPQEKSMGERVLLLKGTWAMIQDHPVLGSGINTFMRNFEKYRPQDCPAGYYAHNSYLQMWAEIGIVGLLAFLAIPFTVIIRVFANIKAKIKINSYGIILLGSLCGYLAFLIHTAFDNDLYSLVLTTLFWIFTAYIVSLNNYLTNRHREIAK